MGTKKLNELDGSLAFMTLGAEIEGDGIVALTSGYYLITAVAETSGLPTNAEVGYSFFADDGITPETGDKVKPMTFEKQCDVQNANAEFTRDEIEDTAICDDVKTYKAGRTDITGTIEGVMTVGITDKTDGLLNKFIDMVEQSADLATLTINKIDNNKIYLQLEINKNSTNDEDTTFYLMPITITSFNAGITKDSVQSFASNFRITEDSEVKSQYFKLKQPVI